MNVAIVGIQGLPNNYGGFETLSEYLVEYLAEEINFTVYCSSVDLPTHLSVYNNAKMKYIPVSSHGAKGIIYDSLALIDAVKNKFDVILILGFGPGFVMPFLSKKTCEKIILNFGGLDWKRDKWGKFTRKIIRLCEKLLVRNSAIVIADNVKIQEYITSTYHKDSELIAYGGDQAEFRTINEEFKLNYPFLNGEYAFTVTRIQSDNNIEMMLKAFVQADKYPFVVVGNWNASEYGRKIKKMYQNKKSLILLDAIYDRKILDVLRSNSTLYIHGHSAGGTNPSLCEAMYLGLPIIAYLSGYNEYTTENEAIYFENEEKLSQIILSYDTINRKKLGEKMRNIATKKYIWKNVANQYREVILKKSCLKEQ